MDGARFANAVVALGVTPKEITWESGVDVLCFGATKNGAAVGEAVVFFNPELAREFDYRCKQAGQLASKMRFLSAPWVGLLQEGAWLRHAKHANAMAKRLETAIKSLAQVQIAVISGLGKPAGMHCQPADAIEQRIARSKQALGLRPRLDGKLRERLLQPGKRIPGLRNDDVLPLLDVARFEGFRVEGRIPGGLCEREMQARYTLRERCQLAKVEGMRPAFG